MPVSNSQMNGQKRQLLSPNTQKTWYSLARKRTVLIYRDSSLQVKGQGGGDEEDLNGSDLVQFFSEADEIKDFFDILDGDFNKVNQFYITKEREFLETGEALKKQLQILVDLKQFLDESRRKCLPAKSNSSIRSSDFSGMSLCSNFALPYWFLARAMKILLYGW